MQYFLDTEFIEDGTTIELISIGIVREDGESYYAINKNFNYSQASEWVRVNVLEPYIGSIDSQSGNFVFKEFLSKNYLKSKQEIAADIQIFINSDDDPRFWADYASYDWIAFCQLFGTMMDLPEGYPMFCRDLRQSLDNFPLLTLPDQEINQHHALYDALWLKEAFEFVTKNSV